MRSSDAIAKGVKRELRQQQCQPLRKYRAVNRPYVLDYNNSHAINGQAGRLTKLLCAARLPGIVCYVTDSHAIHEPPPGHAAL